MTDRTMNDRAINLLDYFVSFETAVARAFVPTYQPDDLLDAIAVEENS